MMNMLFLFMLRYVPLFYFFQVIRNENTPNKGSDAVRILYSGQASCIPKYKIWNPSVSFWRMAFHQRFGRLVGCLMIFARFRLWNAFYFTVIMTYD